MKGKIIGLTGGIGAGKSTVANFFRQNAIPVYSADEIAKEVLSTGSEALKQVAASISKDLIKENGELDRIALRELITRDPHARKALDAITHPRIQAISTVKINEGLSSGAPFVIYEAPLLFEARSEKKVDAVICVIAPDKARIERVMARDKISRQEAERLMRAQMPQEEKARLSNYVISNGGSEQELLTQAAEVYQKILLED